MNSLIVLFLFGTLSCSTFAEDQIAAVTDEKQSADLKSEASERYLDLGSRYPAQVYGAPGGSYYPSSSGWSGFNNYNSNSGFGYNGLTSPGSIGGYGGYTGGFNNPGYNGLGYNSLGYPGNTGLGGYGGYSGYGGYGGYGGNGGYSSYSGYNNPYYNGQNNLGYGYYNRGLGNVNYRNRYVTPTVVSGYRGYTK